MMELDALDKLAASSLDGYLVRKDLVRTFSHQFPVPTYVVEFLLGRYCASIDQDEIDEGLEIVGLIPNQGAYTYSFRQHFIKALPKVVYLFKYENTKFMTT